MPGAFFKMFFEVELLKIGKMFVYFCEAVLAFLSPSNHLLAHYTIPQSGYPSNVAD